MTVLDWRKGHWAGGWPMVWADTRHGEQGDYYHGRWVPGDDRRRQCRWCGRRTFLVDDQGQPAHKVCAERRIDG